MHGEYKVPGGKLVVVDFDVVDDSLQNPQLSGDFFLEPDDALEVINTALQGMPVGATAGAIATRLSTALPPGAELVGFSVEAIAIAVRRAVTRAASWTDYRWEVVHDPALPPRLHLALDEVLAGRVAAGRRPPTLRIWEWNESAVVIGSFQSVKNEVDRGGARRHGFDVVRRISGGGAMLMEKGNVVTYSLYVPSALVHGMSFADSYAFLDDWVLHALRDMDIEASYQPLNDITSPRGKIAGAAQKRFASGALVHHVTMAYDLNNETMLDVLRIGREKLSDKGIESAAKRVDPLRSQTGLPRSVIIERLKDTFASLYPTRSGHVTDDERAEAEQLVATKFATEEWFYRVP